MRPLLFILLALALAALPGCGAKEPAKAEPAPPAAAQPVAEPEARAAEPAMPRPAPIEPPTEVLPASRLSLAKFLRLKTASQYFPPEGIYAPPPESVADKMIVQLAMEPAELHLGTGVSSYAASDNGLAMGFENGEIRIYGDWPCPAVALDKQEPVARLAWHGDSPYLAASGPDSEKVAIFDLRHCAQVATVSAFGTIKDLHISPKGTYLAVVNEANNLYVGTATGPLVKAANLRFANLALTFTPREGLLIAVDQAGWVLLFAPLKGELVSRFQIPGGPFASCDLDPPLATLVPTEGGEPVVWDLAEQGPAEFRGRKTSGYSLRNGVLFYTTRNSLPVKKVLLGAPAFKVDACPDRGLIRVKDLDGADRFYDLTLGGPVNPQECGSWQRLGTDRQGRFCLDETCGALADRVFQSGHMRLMARKMPGDGYYLWWVRTPRPDEYNPLPGSLPARMTVLPDERPAWNPIAPERTSP